MSDAVASPAPGRTQQFLSAAITILAVLAALALVWCTPTKAPFSSPLELKNLTGTFANSTMKSLGLHVPQSGQLSLSVELKGGDFNAYFVRLDGGPSDRHVKGVVILPEFSAEHVTLLTRRAPVTAGFYHLALINTAPAGPHEDPVVRIRAVLDP